MQRALLAAVVTALVSVAPVPSVGQAAPYKIGITLPMTGQFAVNGNTFLVPIQSAVDEINAAGGVKGHPLQIVLEDTQASPQAGVEAMRKVVQVDGAQAVLTFYTNVVMAQIPLADQLKVPTVSPVETPGVMEKTQYSFAYASRAALVFQLLAKHWQATHRRRVFAFFANNAQGLANSPFVRKLVESTGGIYADALIDVNDTDFRGAAIRAKQFNPDAILMNAQGAPAEATVIRQVREVGISAPLYEGANFYKFKTWHDGVGAYTEGMYFAGLDIDQQSAAGRNFARMYRAKTGLEPDYQEAEVYDIIKLFAYAMGAGSYNGEAIRNVLLNLKDFPSALGGTVAMGADHYAVLSHVGLWQARSGKLVPVPVP